MSRIFISNRSGSTLGKFDSSLNDEQIVAILGLLFDFWGGFDKRRSRRKIRRN